MKGLKSRFATRARRLSCYSLPLIFAGLTMPVPAEATIYQLSNLNSSAKIDAGSSAGLENWTVDGVNQVSQQWYWFRIGSGGPQFDLSTISATPYATGSGSNNLTLLYTNSSYGVQLNYILSGNAPGSGKSGLNETARAYNFTSSTQTFHLFMYSDFTLGGQSGNQSVHQGNDGLGDSTSVQVGGSPAVQSNSFVTSTLATHLEAATPFQTRNNLTGVNNYQLDDIASAGPGAVTWAFEWDLTLAPNTSQVISTLDSLQVPELPTTTFITLGFGAWLLRLRRQYKNRS